MIQFTAKEIETLRERAARYPRVVEKMRKQVQHLMDGPILVPETGIANWTHYFYCADCSVQLDFDRASEKAHVCPQCGRVYTGEPYDGAWWGMVTMDNYAGALCMGRLYLLTGEEKYARRAAEMLVRVATHYPNYEVHGDIPYNGPGRAMAQTLDEANFQRNWAVTYDLISDVMTEAEKAQVRDDLFIPGAQFLMERRHNQLHNHEVIIGAAIAIIGLIFDRQDMIDFGVYAPYGLIYQLENGMQDNGMWFEGSFGYHFYALQSFYAYEAFAIHTKHSHIHHPNYEKMMVIVRDYLQPDGQLPTLGDAKKGRLSDRVLQYEFVYRELRKPELLEMLYACYQDETRENVQALLYGVEELPPCPQLPVKACAHPAEGMPGHTILRGEQDRYMLFKHDRYGGEHDHYDRLGLSYLALGREVSSDMGTTGYGAVLHYDYYKNTGTHNTVMIGEENQSPANARLTRVEEKDGVTYVEAECDWRAPFEMPDSFTIVQWDEAAYKNVRMVRRVAWTDAYFAEAFFVESVEDGRTIDWIWHVDGVRQATADEEQVKCLSEKKPFKHLKNVTKKMTSCALPHTFTDGEITTRIHSAAFGGETIFAQGPNCPSYKSISYLIERIRAPKAVFAHVVETAKGEGCVQDATFARVEDHVCVRITHVDGTVREMKL